MIGSRATSGSVAITFRNVRIACSLSSRSASMLTSRMLAPPRTCSSATSTAPREVVGLDQPPEARRAGDVRPLADQHEAGVGADLERLEAAPARPARAAPARRARREARAPRRRSRAVCSGVEPQQLPATLRKPGRRELAAAASSSPPASRRSRRTRSAGRRSGGALTRHGATCASSATYGRISCAPSEQLMPTISGSACSTEAPERLDRLPGERAPREVDDRRRDPERQLGRGLPRGDDRGLRVQRVEDRLEQQQVDPALDERRASARRRPPSPRRRCACGSAGSSTFGLSESVTLSGPTEPATKRSPAASRAIRAAGDVHLVDGVLEPVVGLADRGRRERVRRRDVGAGGEVALVDRARRCPAA